MPQDTRRVPSTWLLAFFSLGCAHAGPAPVARSSPSEQIEGFEAFRCAATGRTEQDRVHSERLARGAALRLSRPVDHVELKHVGGDGVTETFAVRGAKCKTATDAQACELALTARTEEINGPGLYAITSVGDEVALHRGRQAITALLGPIDSPEEAWLVLMAGEPSFPWSACDDLWRSGYRDVADGYELARREWPSTCRPLERVEIVDHVSRAGELTRVRRTTLEHEPEGCLRR